MSFRVNLGWFFHTFWSTFNNNVKYIYFWACFFFAVHSLYAEPGISMNSNKKNIWQYLTWFWLIIKTKHFEPPFFFRGAITRREPGISMTFDNIYIIYLFIYLFIYYLLLLFIYLLLIDFYIYYLLSISIYIDRFCFCFCCFINICVCICVSDFNNFDITL